MLIYIYKTQDGQSGESVLYPQPIFVEHVTG